MADFLRDHHILFVAKKIHFTIMQAKSRKEELDILLRRIASFFTYIMRHYLPDAYGNFSAVVISGALAVEAPEWLRSFSGNRIVVQNEAQNLVWADDAVQAALSVQMLAEGQEVHSQKTTRSAWIYVVYVFAALFALEFLFFLISLGVSLVVGGGL